MRNIALTLPGGGARAAYQAGVLRAISEICQFKESPFQIISGVSAGGINGMWLAAGCQNFDQSTRLMCDYWKSLTVSDVYKTDAITLMQTGASWIRDLSLGRWLKKNPMTYLLDTTPLKAFLESKIDFTAIEKNLDSGLLYGLSLSATDYETGTGVTFFTGDEGIQPWAHTLSLGRRDALTIKHIMASAAIPIFFPPVRIHDRDYGDGGVGLKTPLSPAIRMGASRILVIGVQNPIDVTAGSALKSPYHATLGDMAGVLLNSMFLNSLDSDVSQLNLINRTVSVFTPEQLKADVDRLHQVPALVIRPSQDLSMVGVKEFEHFPFTIRYLLKGLGITDKKGWDLLSYIAFDRVYSASLLDLGYHDAFAIKDKILEFFEPARRAT